MVVKAGQPLYQLDDPCYRADHGTAQANPARARATAEAARLTARRTAELVKISAVSRQDNDNAIAAQRQAEADVKAASAVVAGTRVQLDRARIVAPIGGPIDRKRARLNSSH